MRASLLGISLPACDKCDESAKDVRVRSSASLLILPTDSPKEHNANNANHLSFPFRECKRWFPPRAAENFGFIVART